MILLCGNGKMLEDILHGFKRSLSRRGYEIFSDAPNGTIPVLEHFVVAFYDFRIWNGFPEKRKSTIEACIAGGLDPMSLVSRRATFIGKHGDGTIVMPGSWFGNGRCGDYCVFREESIVHHEAKIGKNVYIDHRASIGRKCTIGDNCVIGKDASVMGGKKICDGVLLEPKTVVTKNIKTPGIYRGNVQWNSGTF